MERSLNDEIRSFIYRDGCFASDLDSQDIEELVERIRSLMIHVFGTPTYLNELGIAHNVSENYATPNSFLNN
jgi:hypothetical protein